MSEVAHEEKPALTKKEKTKAEKQAEHVARIKRTLAASLIGIIAGSLSYWSRRDSRCSRGSGKRFSGIHAHACRLVLQKHIFMFMGMDTSKLGAKDWFYQGFMTFAFWFMTWTILLTSLSPVLK